MIESNLELQKNKVLGEDYLFYDRLINIEETCYFLQVLVF